MGKVEALRAAFIKLQGEVASLREELEAMKVAEVTPHSEGTPKAEGTPIVVETPKAEEAPPAGEARRGRLAVVRRRKRPGSIASSGR